MAAEDKITSARQTFYVGDTAYRRSVSESIMTKFGSASNYIMERIYQQEQFAFNGYFNSNAFDNGVGGIRYVERQANIDQYYMSVRKAGVGGTSAFNVAVYNASGSFVSNLFSTAISISGNSGTNVLLGKKDIQVTPTNFAINTSGHTINNGVLNITQLQEGYMLVPFIVSNAPKAINLFFNLRLQEL